MAIFLVTFTVGASRRETTEKHVTTMMVTVVSVVNARAEHVAPKFPTMQNAQPTIIVQVVGAIQPSLSHAVVGVKGMCHLHRSKDCTRRKEPETRFFYKL